MTAALDDQQFDGSRPGPAGPGCPHDPYQAPQVRDRHDVVGIAVEQENRPVVPDDRVRGADVRNLVSPGSQVDEGREHREGIRDDIGDREACQPERLASEAVRLGGGGGRHEGRHARVGSRGEDGPDAAHRVAGDRSGGHLGPGKERLERRQRVGPELACADGQLLGRVRPVAADVDREDVEARRDQEVRHRQRPVATRFPAVDEDDPRSRLAVAGGDEPRRQLRPGGWKRHLLEREAQVRGCGSRCERARVAGPRPVDEGEPVGEREWRRGDGGRQPGAANG
jgi:hypothetical protein